MSTAVGVYTTTHSYIYVTNQLLNSIKRIVQLSGLDPDKMVGQWETLELGIRTWLADGDLEKVLLEVYDSQTNELVHRWDLEIYYGQSGDGSFWQDPEDIRYNIHKAGLDPANCDYEILTTTADGRRDVKGWSRTTLRSTDGFVRQGIGTMIGAGEIAAGAYYWRKK
jgi:hypothetical protein